MTLARIALVAGLLALVTPAAADVARMLERCKDGPRSAHVTAVEVVEEGGDAPDAFEVLPTA